MTILVTRPTFPDVLELLRRHGEVSDSQTGVAEDAASLARRFADVDGALVFGRDRIDADLLVGSPRLRVVANMGVGYDNIDVAACTARGIMVTNTPGAMNDSTADLVFGLMLAAARRIAEADAYVRSELWAAKPDPYFGVDVHHKTVGILGMGRIGKVIAKRAQGFDMELIYHNRTRLSAEAEAASLARYVSFDTLLRESDFLVVQLPYSAENRHLIGAAELAMMKNSAVLINTARGGVVDDAALIEALAAGRLAGAGLDVFEHEPSPNPGFYALKNVVMTPHVGSATQATRHAMAMQAANNLIAALSGMLPPDLVNPEVAPIENKP